MRLAEARLGFVEPNPPVGAVILSREGLLLGTGCHEEFGAHHAEVNAIRAAGDTADATIVVTLEPCCHHGQTPPCTDAILKAGIRRVVIGSRDPAKHSSARGIEVLSAAGIEIEAGILAEQTDELIAPFRKLFIEKRPWVHAKWAMTLDGKTATNTGESKWISNEESRAIVHELRGRMDAIVVGAGTALADDPLLTARPPGPRIPTRIVIDSDLRLPPDSQLVQSACESPVMVFCRSEPAARALKTLQAAGVEVVPVPASEKTGGVEVNAVFHELGKRSMTNVLVEGGGTLVGSLLDAGLIDEVHAFIGPRLFGGALALSPAEGTGFGAPAEAPKLKRTTVRQFDNDIYVTGRVDR